MSLLTVPTLPTSQEVRPASENAADSLPLPARKAKPAKHIPALDGVRGLAIGLVLIFHFSQLGFMPRATGAPAILQKITACGWVGVDLFFVLSGFLITSILCEAKGSAG